MKKTFLILLMLVVSHIIQAQKECSNKMRKIAGLIDTTLVQQRLRALSVTATTPYIIKLHVVMFATDDGSRVPATHADIRRQIQNMVDFYASHDICFVLGVIQQVNKSALYAMDIAEEEDDLSPYIRPGYVTIFVHNSVFDGVENYNGYAYGIPNSYLSVSGPAIEDTNNISTLAHEMGHCFGLYHTFENIPVVGGEENVARSGGCKDCDTDGDYLCDTQADRDPTSLSFIDPVTCTYTGNRRDECGSLLLMEPENIMSYGRRPCRKRFTAGQGNRARSYIISESELTDAIAGDNFNIFFSTVSTNDYKIYLARNTVTFNASTWLATGSAKVSASAKAIVVKAGTQFQPTSDGGYAILRVNPYCQ